MNDTAILIGTHDRYRAAWPAMCYGLNKYLKLDWPVYWSTNNLEAPSGCGIGLKIGGDRQWGRNTRWALIRLQSLGYKTILWMLEDTWLTKLADIETIKDYVLVIQKNNKDHIRFVSSPSTIRDRNYEYDENLFYIDQDSPYRTSMCAGLWNIQTFLELIIDADTVWSFEKEGTMRSKGRRFLCAKHNPMPYVLPEEGSGYAWSPIKRGKWTAGAKQWAELEGVEIDFSRHPKDY